MSNWFAKQLELLLLGFLWKPNRFRSGMRREIMGHSLLYVRHIVLYQKHIYFVYSRCCVVTVVYFISSAVVHRRTREKSLECLDLVIPHWKRENKVFLEAHVAAQGSSLWIVLCLTRCRDSRYTIVFDIIYSAPSITPLLSHCHHLSWLHLLNRYTVIRYTISSCFLRSC
jgi:hypothetical protein